MDQRLEALQQQLEKLRDYADNYPAIQERLGNACLLYTSRCV